MLNNKTLIQKRTRKEAKRKAHRKALAVGKRNNEKYVKRHALKEAALRTVLSNPVLREQYFKNQDKLKVSTNVDKQVLLPNKAS